MCKIALIIMCVTFFLGLLTGMFTIFRGTDAPLLSQYEPFGATECGVYDSAVEFCDDVSDEIGRTLDAWLKTQFKVDTEAYNDQVKRRFKIDPVYGVTRRNVARRHDQIDGPMCVSWAGRLLP